MIPAATVFPCSRSVLHHFYLNRSLIRHHCNRKVDIRYQDDPPITVCDVTATRTWVISDDCNQNVTFEQTVKILPIQKPISPKDGEENVGLEEALVWPTYPNSFLQKLYLWKDGESRQNVANSSWAYFWPYYRPYGQKHYPPNSKMLWQVEYHLNEGYLVKNQSIIPSPIWSFQTTKIADFSVMNVNSPETFFTGRNMQVSWTVENIGSRGNVQPRWYDWAFLSRDVVMTSRTLLSKVVGIQRFILPGDTYTATATISIPNDLYGTVYVHVIIDCYNYLSEVNRTNNHGVNLQPLVIKLTAPPDLQVDQIVAPERTFSGN